VTAATANYLQAPRASSQQWKAFGSALGLEAAAALALVAWFSLHPPQLPQLAPLALVIEPLAAEQPEPPPALNLPKLQPIPVVQNSAPVPKTVKTLEARVQPPAAPPQQPLPLPATSPPVLAPPVASATAPPLEPMAAPVPVVSPPVASATVTNPPAAHSAAANGDAALAYNAKLAAAVQAAFEVPTTAVELNFKGRSRVEFKLVQGLAIQIVLVQPSGLGVVDRAAIRAVQSAVFPSPPPGLQARDGTYQIWVACL
jgi:periplasmic protein TonB